VTAPVAFYTVSSREYFLGAVALINSLRLQGHDEPVYVLDRGLSDAQRRILAGEATVVPGPPEAPPHLLKTIAPNAHPADVMVLMDADMIVTRPLGALVEEAAAGKVVAFAGNEDRWEPAWGELLDLGELERRRYLSSAFVALGGTLGAEVMRVFGDRVSRVDVGRSSFEINLLDPTSPAPDYPLHLLDQDVLNAVVARLVPSESVVALEPEGMALIPFDGLRVTDERGLRCVYRGGGEPYLLHHMLPGKPWLEAAPESPFSRLLRRSLTGPDLAIAVPVKAIPRRLRSGPVAALERARGRAGLRLRMFTGLWRARLGNAAHRVRGRAAGGSA
jgi:hypothetical protein